MDESLITQPTEATETNERGEAMKEGYERIIEFMKGDLANFVYQLSVGIRSEDKPRARFPNVLGRVIESELDWVEVWVGELAVRYSLKNSPNNPGLRGDRIAGDIEITRGKAVETGSSQETSADINRDWTLLATAVTDSWIWINKRRVDMESDSRVKMAVWKPEGESVVVNPKNLEQLGEKETEVFQEAVAEIGETKRQMEAYVQDWRENERVYSLTNKRPRTDVEIARISWGWNKSTRGIKPPAKENVLKKVVAGLRSRKLAESGVRY